MRTRTRTHSRIRPGRHTQSKGRNRKRNTLGLRNGTGSRTRRARLATKAAPVVARLANGRAGLAGHTNGDRPHLPAEMDRNDPQFKSALKDFAAATRLFQKQHYGKAQAIFEKLVTSPARELAERARMHVVLCQQRRARSEPPPKSAEVNYNLGVAELNARHLQAAIEHLIRADRGGQEREHVKYALAAAHALQGNADLALQHLKAAIDLRPGNRFLARSDGDFHPLISDPRFKRLVGSADGGGNGVSS